MSWQFDLASDIGGRAEQQDRLEVLPVPQRRGEYLVVLADGMGGQQQGALAAETVIETARAMLDEIRRVDPRPFLMELCSRAHALIREIGRRNRTNPASTCTALYVKGDEAYWIHVGDSRLCHFSGESLLLRSSEHTLGALLSSSGDEPGASGTVRRGDNRLYMCLGGHNALEPEYGASADGADDWFLLCSDGFWNHVEPDEVARRLRSNGSSVRASDLLATALERAGKDGDNLSLALVTPQRSATKKPWWRLF